jgi:hypothetical protein
MLADKMTPEQIAEGKRLASEWKPTSTGSDVAAGATGTDQAGQIYTPTPSDFQALALAPSKLTKEAFAALTPAQQKMVCSTRAFVKQIDAQKGVMDKMKLYSTKYLSPAENDLVVAASDDYLARIMKAKGF